MDAYTRMAVAFERIAMAFELVADHSGVVSDALTRIADSVEREEVRWADTRAVRDPDLAFPVTRLAPTDALHLPREAEGGGATFATRAHDGRAIR
jgi:hypothetical protein